MDPDDFYRQYYSRPGRCWITLRVSHVIKVFISGVIIAAVSVFSVSAADGNTVARTDAPAAASPEESTAPESDADKVKCKSVRGTTSLIPTRVCKSKAQWAAQDRDTRDAVESERRKGDRAQGS